MRMRRNGCWISRDTQMSSPRKLRDLFQSIRAKVDPQLLRTGLCIDTAHLWSCGVDLSSHEDAEKWLLDLEGYSDVIPAETQRSLSEHSGQSRSSASQDGAVHRHRAPVVLRG